MIKIVELTCEYFNNPIGIDVSIPRFSWKMNSDDRNVSQKKYQMQFAYTPASFDTPFFDTGIMHSDKSVLVEYDGPELTARTRYYYRLRVWDNLDRVSNWSDLSFWETGLMTSSNWEAKWITADLNEIDRDSKEVLLLRQFFSLTQPVQSARIYATAAGAYDLFINNEAVSNDILAPGWTSYHNRTQYQTYDVTYMLKTGLNGIGIRLGDGWYRGDFGFDLRNYNYGLTRAALLQLHVQFQDGTEVIISTDDTWESKKSAILYSSIYHGEFYDARLELEGWTLKREVGNWYRSSIVDLPYSHLVSQENWPTKVTEKIKPIQYSRTPNGQHVIDFGQNMVGRVRFQVDAPAGTEIVLRHAEVLDKDGNIYFGNLRPAKQTVKFIAAGNGVVSYAPTFTFQGFRYISVEGWPNIEDGLSLESFVGEVIHSDMPRNGHFECSDERVNQLYRNIVWGQRGNFLDIPTDCPQRDERLGWTGDAQVFISTALTNYHGGPFFTKWLRDLKTDQRKDGGVAHVVPDIIGGANSAAWGDAATICPWTVYQYYEDKRVLADQYESMKAWVDYIRNQGNNEYEWNTGFHFGDWLALDAKENSYIGATPARLIATAFFAYSTEIVKKTAEILGKAEDFQFYSTLHERIVRAFQAEFMTENGRVAVPTQTAHVLVLLFNLVKPGVKERVANDLYELILDNDFHLTTGFVGTPYLCLVLSENGYHDAAVKLLLQDSYPGWLYSVSKGATTIWEHWDSIKEDGSFWSDDMNSFNHYAYGAVADWMFKKLAGLDKVSNVPGFKEIYIEPKYGITKISAALATYETMYGEVGVSWEVREGNFRVDIHIPANTQAKVVLNGSSIEHLFESNKLVEVGNGILSINKLDEAVEIIVGSGSYCFTYANDKFLKTIYSEKSRMSELYRDPQAEAVLRKHVPRLIGGALRNIISGESLEALSKRDGFTGISQEKLNEILNDLAIL